MWTNDVQDPVNFNENSSKNVCQKEFDCVEDLIKHVNEFHLVFVAKPPFICQWHGLVIIIYLYMYISTQGRWFTFHFISISPPDLHPPMLWIFQCNWIDVCCHMLWLGEGWVFGSIFRPKRTGMKWRNIVVTRVWACPMQCVSFTRPAAVDTQIKNLFSYKKLEIELSYLKQGFRY